MDIVIGQTCLVVVMLGNASPVHDTIGRDVAHKSGLAKYATAYFGRLMTKADIPGT